MAKLVVLQGPDAGVFFSLGDRDTLGRAPSNSIVLHDLRSSDQAAEIWRDAGGGFRLRRHPSASDVYLNARAAAHEEGLQHGDMIQAGGSLLLFDAAEDERSPVAAGDAGTERTARHDRTLLAEDEGPPPDALEDEGDPGHLPATDRTPAQGIPAALLRAAGVPETPGGGAAGDSGDAAAARPVTKPLLASAVRARRKPYRDLAALLERVRRLERPGEWLAALFKVSVALSATDDIRDLFGRILALVLEDLPADRGFILLRDRATGTFRPAAVRTRSGTAASGGERVEGLSRTIIQEVFRTGEALLCADVLSDERFNLRQSIHEQSILSVMCVPLFKDRDVLGVVQVNSETYRAAFSEEDLDLLSAIALQIQGAVERLELQETTREKQRMEEEIKNAEKVQQFLLPKRVPALPGISIGFRSQLSHGLGGDYYDFIELDDGRLGLVIGDVSGHNISSALILSSVRTLIRRNCQVYQRPAPVLEATNDFIKREIPPGMFVTLFLGVFDPRTYSLIYVNAGQNYPLLLRGQSGRIEELARGGLPLGVFRATAYEEVRVDLATGDSLLLYTDALVEAKDPSGRRYGVEALRSAFGRLCAHGARALVDSLYSEVVTYHSGRGLEDDLTLVALSVEERRQNFSFSFPSTREDIGPAVERAGHYARELSFVDAEGEAKFRLAMVELITNAVEHGNRFDMTRRVVVFISAGELTLEISVRDDGHGFDPRRVGEEAQAGHLTRPRGRGLLIVQEVVGKPRWNAIGNEVTVTIERGQLAGGPKPS